MVVRADCILVELAGGHLSVHLFWLIKDRCDAFVVIAQRSSGQGLLDDGSCLYAVNGPM